ncbi:MAG TPA: DUF6600 domain-containing protein [Bryobacteraceae bacterium]|nr:DUF6600 domain-containing protein [Bryobacteraceae bacterium]
MQRHVLLLIAASAAVAFGQVDPPTRVARLNYISGSVSFQPAGMDEWAPAAINRPMTTGDQIWVDQDSRAELHIGSAGLRLGPGTAFQILNLNDQTAQIQITQGSVHVHVRFLDPDQTFEVDTPGMAFSLLRPGTYRVDANPDSATTVATVRDGQAEVTGGGQAFNVTPGEQVIATGTDQVSFDMEPAPGADGFDQWCLARVAREDRSMSRRYVNPQMIGYEDLDDNGYWRDDPQYGEVWYPRSVPGGWAPYHYGHWAWIDPWGWTWVDDAPWGFAPFHYGRWAYMGGAWGWIPGPVAVRPVYAPALVAWVGGSHFSMSLSFGGGGAVAWIPLGPREVYVPSYHVSQGYFTRVNTSNTVVNNVNITRVYNTTIINNNVTNVTTVNYVNARAPNAVVAVPANALASARPVYQVARPVPPQALAQAQVVHTAAVTPQPAAVLGHGSMPQGVARPPARALNTPVVARTAPPPPPPSFTARQAVLQQHPGLPIDPQAMRQLRTATPAAVQPRPPVRVVEAVQTVAPPVRGQRTPPRPQTGQSVQNNGRFGGPPPAAYTGAPQGAGAAAGPAPAAHGATETYRYTPPRQMNQPPANTPPQQPVRPSYGPPAGVRTPPQTATTPPPSQTFEDRRGAAREDRGVQRAEPDNLRPMPPPRTATPPPPRTATPPPTQTYEERRGGAREDRGVQRAEPENLRPMQPPPQTVRQSPPPPPPRAATPPPPPQTRTNPNANREREREKDKDKR